MCKIRKDYLAGIDLEKLTQIANSKMSVSYAYLCKEINIMSLTGDSKKRQLMMLEQICNFEKNGRIFVFDGMKNQDEVKQTKAKNINFTYSELVENLLIHYIASQNQQTVFLTTQQLFEITGAANKNYSFARYGIKNPLKYKAIISMHKKEFTHYELRYMVFSLYMNILREIIVKSIPDINKRNNIIIERGYIGVVKIDTKQKIFTNIQIDSKDGQLLQSISTNCLKNIGVKNVNDLFLLSGGIKRYYQERAKQCRTQTQYANFYDCYVITLNPQAIEQYDNTILLHRMNEKIKKRIYNNPNFLSDISVRGLTNLTNALVDINTAYNFQNDYIKYKEENAIG